MKTKTKKKHGKPNPAVLADIVARVVRAIQPQKIVLFGSAARGTMGRDSDIDLLVVRPRDVEADDDAWSEQLYEIANTVHRWTGNGTNILELGGTEVLEAAGNEDPVLVAISEEGIQIQGPSSFLRRILAGVRS